MKTDINPDICLFEYPSIDRNHEITVDDIKSFFTLFNNKISCKFENCKDYYTGKNCNNSGIKEENAPNNNIKVPYARTQTQIVKGYMFRPGYITYKSENENYSKEIENIFNLNHETLKTAELGENQSKYGIAFEILYTDNSSEDNAQTNTLPYFYVPNPKEIIPVFYKDFTNELACFLRFYLNKENDDGSKEYTIEFYDKAQIIIYTAIVGIDVFDLTEIDTKEHFFEDVPLSIYINNIEYFADFEPVKTLIDSYDKLNSDAMNELDRFAAAYLILKNYILANGDDINERNKKLEMLKKTRVFEIGSDGEIKFLTKDIPVEFFNTIKQSLRDDIEYHSHIPDFRSKNFEAKSGEAQKWALLDFENLCSGKQAWFEVGLQRRIELINNFLKVKAIESFPIAIKFERNLPNNDAEQITNVKMIKDMNLGSDKDLIKLLPKDMIGDPEIWYENLKAQKEEETPSFNLDSIGDNNDSQGYITGNSTDSSNL